MEAQFIWCFFNKVIIIMSIYNKWELCLYSIIYKHNIKNSITNNLY